MARRQLGVGQAAARLHDRRLGQAGLAGPFGQAVQVSRQQGGQGRVHLGGRRPLVLAEGPDHLVRQRDVDVGKAPRERLPQPALVLGVPVGVQQHHRHRLGPGALDLVAEVLGRRRVQLPQRPARPDPLGRAEAQLRGDEGGRMGRAQPVEVRPGLPSQLDHVGETLGGDQRRAGALPLQKGVGGHRHAVGERLDVTGAPVPPLQGGADRCHHALRLVVRRGRRLGGVQPAVGGDDRVGEGAADIDPEQHLRARPAHRGRL